MFRDGCKSKWSEIKITAVEIATQMSKVCLNSWWVIDDEQRISFSVLAVPHGTTKGECSSLMQFSRLGILLRAKKRSYVWLYV